MQIITHNSWALLDLLVLNGLDLYSTACYLLNNRASYLLIFLKQVWSLEGFLQHIFTQDNKEAFQQLAAYWQNPFAKQTPSSKNWLALVSTDKQVAITNTLLRFIQDRHQINLYPLLQSASPLLDGRLQSYFAKRCETPALDALPIGPIKTTYQAWGLDFNYHLLQSVGAGSIHSSLPDVKPQNSFKGKWGGASY